MRIHIVSLEIVIVFFLNVFWIFPHDEKKTLFFKKNTPFLLKIFIFNFNS
ncbi:hypothetical protein GLOIN_2v1686483 [Rhizophagus irregularis DAOM 181602=DAOM 197198]|uniref:Uncharacterized protein n=1 Tax=Rhizophagus irregularis (strain DAOM 181602 / DAOM 197198 / MUCL 43194) TaxID=747089 RepID=A0A2P4PDI1_RHIID|nr:hypothetical protein GLOIN_2v1686483 [Rhizophagus irregularis DAOM 181602=DAOM 197198]POG63443.1 hypothetical protein GLOIN_2v1686483 [Rhizophagus irregularis DAOM 181602=DAOM 197198]|eukprot:XP_025170309.1 hypothetical protein GLOIN_2v1686483 [Rhizophagus irregularis DAOM 181602=DAOM 197198]